ncbi:MAG: hypothetical protein GX589_06455 [Deltaproteobacteria bacterium]|nr:hypothetical protein [Deltaproteobacteria bacterium]
MVRGKVKKIDRSKFSHRVKADSCAAKEAVGRESQEESSILAFWSEALDALEGRSFCSEDEAIYAVIDLVLERLTKGGDVEPGLRDFLKDLFDTDPELREEIRGILSIRS